MADAQIAIIDGDQTQVVLAPGENPAIVASIPGPQGPAGAVAAAIDGSAALPSIAFASDTDTGLYRVGANQLGVSTGGTQRLVIDSNGQIEATSLGTAASPTWTFVGDPNTGIYSPGADQLALSTGGTGRFLLNNGGLKLGDITGDPNVLLHLDLAPASTGSAGVIGFGDIGNIRLAEIEGFREGGSFAGSLIFRTQISSGSTGAGAERLRITSTGQLSHIGAGSVGSPAVSFSGSAPSNSLVIDSSGRAGLGTSTPSERLDLGGGVSDTVKIRFSMGGNVGSIGSVGSGVANGLGNLTFFTRNGATEVAAMTIDGSQRVGIGTTPDSILHVLGPGGIAGLRVGYNNTSVNYYDADTQIFRAANATERARIDSSGTFRVKGAGTGGVNDAVQLNGSAPANSLLLDASGRLLVGTSSSTASVGQTAQLQVAGSARITSGLASTIDVGSIAQNATTAIALPRSGMYCIYVGTMNLFALFLATINGGSQGVRLIYSTASDVVAGLTTEPAGGTYLRLWISGQQLQVKNVNAFTGPYFITALATGD